MNSTTREWVVIVSTLAVLGMFVWPTFWQTEVIKGYTWRFNRLSGCSQVKTPNRDWIPAGPKRCDGNYLVYTPPPPSPPTEEKKLAKKLEENLQVVRIWKDRDEFDSPALHIKIHNNSNCNIDEAMFSMIHKKYGDIPLLSIGSMETDDGRTIDGTILLAGDDQTVTNDFYDGPPIPDGDLPINEFTVDWQWISSVLDSKPECQAASP